MSGPPGIVLGGTGPVSGVGVGGCGLPQAQTGCHGNGASHCCWWQGEPCPWLEENTVPGRRWACGLYRQYGNWDDVHVSSEYAADVEPRWRASGEVWEWLWELGVRCGSWGLADAPGRQGMGNLLKVKGNDPQWKHDFQQACIAGWQTVQQGGSYEPFCCLGNASYAQDESGGV